MNVLLVTHPLDASAIGGRELLCRLNRDVLSNLLGDRLSTIELARPDVRGLRSAVRAIGGYIDGVSPDSIATTVGKIRSDAVRKVFVDGSNLGTLAKAIKSECPDVEVLSFFHNCETRFFLGALRQRPSVHAAGVLLANYVAERRAVRSSDSLICLSERDSRALARLYGRHATHVSPMAMRDRLPADHESAREQTDPGYALFVGGSFYANQTGIEWFARHVAPHVPIGTRVVGHGFESNRDRLERHGNVKVIGSVDDLAPWYLGSRFVIAPIFDGSGMKTKVAEALMFGKRVIGTPEAFSGYEDVVDAAGVVCRSAADFERAIRSELEREPVPFDRELRALYEKRYSVAAATSRLAAILGILE